jgi:hypothetical protein
MNVVFRSIYEFDEGGCVRFRTDLIGVDTVPLL